jgi:hypothetical protein
VLLIITHMNSVMFLIITQMISEVLHKWFLWLLWFYSQRLENVSSRLIWFSVCLIKITFAARKVFCNVFKYLWNHKQNISDYFSFTFEINNILLSFSKSVWIRNQNHSVFYFIYFWNQYRMFFWPNTLNYSMYILCLL